MVKHEGGREISAKHATQYPLQLYYTQGIDTGGHQRHFAGYLGPEYLCDAHSHHCSRLTHLHLETSSFAHMQRCRLDFLANIVSYPCDRRMIKEKSGREYGAKLSAQCPLQLCCTQGIDTGGHQRCVASYLSPEHCSNTNADLQQ